MSWDYDKAREKPQENWWTACSDLFLMLSVVFLLMYVVSSLRTQTEGISNLVENRKLEMTVQDLREQTRVYNTLKNDYLEKQATEDEKKTYDQLMEKLSLLKDEAAQEKRKLRMQAEENEQKEMALNQYQQIIRNIINANVMAKASIKRRDEKITEKTQQLVQTSEALESTSAELQAKSQALTLTEKNLKQQTETVQALQEAINEKKAQIAANNNAIEAAKGELATKIRELRKQEANSDKLKGKISALKKASDSRIAALEAQNAGAGNALRESSAKMAELEGALKESKGALRAAEGQNQKFKEYIDALKSEKDDIAADLAKSKEQLNEKRKLAQSIKNALAKAGVAGEVNAESGDVIISFGEEYFDTGKSSLKPGMTKILERFFPAYSKALFSNDNIAKKIESVEIIGYSSPTYRGKYVDPQSLTENDRAAVNYNLDLSYHRARSIFKHLTNSNEFNFPYQKQLLPTIKVTGRSYLSENLKGRDLKSGISQAEFCKQFDCKKQQRVIIKFDLKK
jgi:outer membrane protein OmpA-like peptidoglycan-associated protein